MDPALNAPHRPRGDDDKLKSTAILVPAGLLCLAAGATARVGRGGCVCEL